MTVRARRVELGWSQATLAQRAGVSRQLVSAVESGRHEPGVSAALALASALGVSVEQLFRGADPQTEAVSVVGESLAEGPVRVGSVRGRTTAVPVPPLDELDGVVPDGRWTGAGLQLRKGRRPAELVLAGCEPALGVLGGLVAARSDALWVRTSSGAARSALAAGRVHVVAVHDRSDRPPAPPDGVVAFEVARWRVGVAFDRRQVGSASAVLDAVVETGGAVVQRERSAGTQAAFERWVRRQRRPRPPGPTASGHVEVCRLVGAGAGLGGVTAEPVAIAAGLAFDPLEDHVVQLWCPRDLLGEPAVADLLDRFSSAAFADRVAAWPAYDVARLGAEVA